MINLCEEVLEIADFLMEKKNIAQFEALQIAVKIQHNRVFSDSFLVGKGGNVALEQLAMELGANGNGNTIKEALNNIAEALNNIAS